MYFLNETSGEKCVFRAEFLEKSVNFKIKSWRKVQYLLLIHGEKCIFV